MRIAVVGKGGAGKSVIAGTLARTLARRGHRVLALDSDFMPGLALSLGATQPPEPPLLAAAERDDDGRWRLRRGIGPVRAIQRFATDAPDGIRLLQPGKFGADGLQAIMPAVQAYTRIVHALSRPKSLRSWTIVGDLPAGPRQTAFDWAPYADTFLVVVEPTWKSALAARRIAGIARSRGPRAVYVANKLAGDRDAGELERRLQEPLFAAVPADEAVAAAERAGRPLIEHAPDAPATRAIAEMAERLERE